MENRIEKSGKLTVGILKKVNKMNKPLDQTKKRDNSSKKKMERGDIIRDSFEIKRIMRD